MNTTVGTYHYTECGLPNIYIEGLCTEDDAEEKTILLPNINDLHRLIAREIIISDGTLTGPELRYLRTEMGMTQTELGELVHRERLTISRWEREECVVDGAAEALIRICALIKLKLKVADPEEKEIDLEDISAKCTLPTTHKGSIHIDGTDPKNYQLVA